MIEEVLQIAFSLSHLLCDGLKKSHGSKCNFWTHKQALDVVDEDGNGQLSFSLR